MELIVKEFEPLAIRNANMCWSTIFKTNYKRTFTVTQAVACLKCTPCGLSKPDSRDLKRTLNQFD